MDGDRNPITENINKTYCTKRLFTARLLRAERTTSLQHSDRRCHAVLSPARFHVNTICIFITPKISCTFVRTKIFQRIIYGEEYVHYRTQQKILEWKHHQKKKTETMAF